MLGATYEIKLDGYRIEVVRTGGQTTLYSRKQNVLNHKFHYIAKALDYLPADTVLDGELVALGPTESQVLIFCRTSSRTSRTSLTTPSMC